MLMLNSIWDGNTWEFIINIYVYVLGILAAKY